MTLIGDYFKKQRAIRTFSSTDGIERWGNTFFYPLGSVDLFGKSNYLNDFIQVPEVNAIINIRARAMASWALSIQSKQTGQEANGNESLVRVLRAPNWFQGQGEFWRQSELFRSIYGNEFLYFLTPVGMPNTYKGLFTINPDQVEITYKNENPFFLDDKGEAVTYKYCLPNGTKIPLDRKNIIHLNDNRVKKDNFLEGTSKLEALQPAIKNIRAAYEKRNIALNMPIGIIGNAVKDAMGQAVPHNSEEKKKAEMAIKTKRGLPIITNMGVTYDHMQVNSESLGLFKEVREDTGRICDAFGVPYEVLANEKGVTFANLKEAKKQMYEESIMPDGIEKVDAVNLQLRTDSRSWHLAARYDHLPVFAEDVKQRSISLKQLIEALSKALSDKAITLDQYKAELQKFGI